MADPKSVSFAHGLATFMLEGRTPTKSYALNQARKASRELGRDLKLSPPQKILVQVIVKEYIVRAAAWGKKHPSER